MILSSIFLISSLLFFVRIKLLDSSSSSSLLFLLDSSSSSLLFFSIFDRFSAMLTLNTLFDELTLVNLMTF